MSFEPLNQFANLVMDSYVLAYIASRMQQQGIRRYNFEPHLALLNEYRSEYNIGCGNDHFFLVSKELPIGTEIHADNNILIVADYHSYMQFAGVQEFTGIMNIKVPPDSGLTLFEFIRVMPKFDD